MPEIVKPESLEACPLDEQTEGFGDGTRTEWFAGRVDGFWEDQRIIRQTRAALQMVREPVGVERNLKIP